MRRPFGPFSISILLCCCFFILEKVAIEIKTASGIAKPILLQIWKAMLKEQAHGKRKSCKNLEIFQILFCSILNNLSNHNHNVNNHNKSLTNMFTKYNINAKRGLRGQTSTSDTKENQQANTIIWSRRQQGTIYPLHYSPKLTKMLLADSNIDEKQDLAPSSDSACNCSASQFLQSKYNELFRENIALIRKIEKMKNQSSNIASTMRNLTAEFVGEISAAMSSFNEPTHSIEQIIEDYLLEILQSIDQMHAEGSNVKKSGGQCNLKATKPHQKKRNSKPISISEYLRHCELPELSEQPSREVSASQNESKQYSPEESIEIQEGISQHLQSGCTDFMAGEAVPVSDSINGSISEYYIEQYSEESEDHGYVRAWKNQSSQQQSQQEKIEQKALGNFTKKSDYDYSQVVSRRRIFGA